MLFNFYQTKSLTLKLFVKLKVSSDQSVDLKSQESDEEISP
jgi:hypothetical protein